MSEDLNALARVLDAVVSDVPDVATVFAADPLLVRSAKKLTAGEDALPLIAVASSDGTLSVVVSIGVTGDEQAPLTAAAVAAAIRAALPERQVTISVRVSRIATVPTGRESTS